MRFCSHTVCLLAAAAVSLGCLASGCSGPAHSGGAVGGEDLSAYLPNSTLTPGDTLPVSMQDVCTPGYAHRVRDVPYEEKQQVYDEYGMPHHAPRQYEVDHLISLELGGSNRKKNLWPQPYFTRPWNAHVKDKLENELHRLVCDGKLTLPAAQHMIASNWIAAYRQVFHTQQPLASGSGRGGGYRGYSSGSVPAASAPAPAAGGSTSGQVWVNTRSGKFFRPGQRWYGHTREGEYMSKQQALQQGYRPAGGY